MHVVNPQSALLTNHEVQLFLREQEAEYTGTDGTGRKRRKPKGYESILKDTLHYFEAHDSVHAMPSFAKTHPTRPMTLYKGPNALLQALAPKFRLNKAEFLQLYNLKPSTQVELQLIIEESHARFTEDQLDEMLAIMGEVFAEEEANIPAGAEDQQMQKIPNKLLGASRKRRKGGKRKA